MLEIGGDVLESEGLVIRRVVDLERFGRVLREAGENACHVLHWLP